MPSTFRYVGLKFAALASVSVLALPAHAQTTADSAAPTPPAANVVTPMYGAIRPFYGAIRPFYGNVRPFYGNLNPFYGNVRPFWGNIQPFWGNINPFYGNVRPFWGNLKPFTGADGGPTGEGLTTFWTDAGASWTSIADSWSVADTAEGTADYATVADQLQGLVDKSASFWGSTIQTKTGKSFQDAFAAPLLAKYGIDLSDSSSLAALSESDRAMFFLDWYDGLMNYSGADRVDHWMRTVNWTPSLTQTQGSGVDTVIGLLDFTVAGDSVLQQTIIKYDGVSNFTNGHGAAVASLVVGAHDGQGVMGIAPKASVIAYNPFDSTGTASWGDITNGILMLTSNGASIVNMSLGVPGSTLDQGWNDVFSNAAVAAATKKTVFVTAAGNEGVVQTQDLTWNFATNPNLIVVGSVDLAGEISGFSNQPGQACLLDGGICHADNRLMNHFIVAPGELILVSDDQGGTVRMSGTSFAAPLVSGAIALLHDRWPWLANYPKLTSEIILRTAKDLGTPGVDPVYGVGLLDVTASQSPLSFDGLKWLYADDKGKIKEQNASNVVATVKSENQQKFDTKGIYYYSFEFLEGSNRDFAIPLSAKLVGQTVTTVGGTQEQFQDYLLARMTDWATSQAPGNTAGSGSNGFSAGAAVANPWGMDMQLSMAPRSTPYGFRQDGPLHQTKLHISGETVDIDLGFGDGAPVINGVAGLGLASAYDSERGGVNPVLGLASGGGFANVRLALNDRLSLSAGATQRHLRRDPMLMPGVETGDNGARTYDAAAQHVALTYRVADGVELTGSYTRLREASALLGVQSVDPNDFAHGSTTDAVTAGFGVALGWDVTMAASGTLARTRQSEDAQAIAVADGGLSSSAYELALTKPNLFAKGDRARVSLSQPMFVERGRFDVTTVQVVDRQTGEIGVVTQSFDVTQERPYAAELLYGRSLLEGSADLTLFGRVDVNPGLETDSQAFMAGARLRFGF